MEIFIENIDIILKVTLAVLTLLGSIWGVAKINNKITNKIKNKTTQNNNSGTIVNGDNIQITNDKKVDFNSLFRDDNLKKLFVEMRSDLKKEKFKREFILSEKGWAYWGSGNEFIYYFDDHIDLKNMVIYLENIGLVRNITTKNVDRYRFEEKFVEMLLNSKEI